MAYNTKTLGRELDWDYNLVRAEELDCIFVHLPKNGGISVNTALFNGLGGGHIPLFLYLWLYGARDFDRMFKFAFSRHPVARVKSAFAFLRGGGITEDDAAFGTRWIGADARFDAFVQEMLPQQPVINSLHFRPQSFFLDDPRTGRSGVDFLGRVETLAEDYERVTQRLGIENTLQVLNRSERRETVEMESPASRRVIEDLYRRDFEQLDYD